MTARKGKVSPTKIKKKVEELAREIEGLDGIDMAFANDLLQEYARTFEMVQALGSQIQSEGVMVEVQKGGANNRHTEKVENPAFGTYYKATARLTDLAIKTSKFVHQGGDDGEEEDPLDAFNSARPD